MITLKQQLAAALEGACAQVVFGYPKDFTGAPLLCWREAGSRCYAQADGREHLAELEYSVDIFASSPEEAGEILALADGHLQELGMRRQAAAEQFEQDTALSHISARYRALADAQGRIYQ